MSYTWSEEDLQRQVLDLAGLLGWRRAHFRPARTKNGWRTPVEGDGAGFPDLILVKGKQLIVAELKSQSGTLSPEQHQWLLAFGGLPGARIFCWRPNDWPEIERVLKDS